MRVALAVATVLALVSQPLAASAVPDEELVYLLPDANFRYRPVIDMGGSPRLLAEIASITPPAVSPDGSRVAFSGAVGDESLGRYAIFLVDVDGSGLDQLTAGSFGEMDPAWSPDGDAIVVSQNQSGSLTRSSCCRLARVEVGTGEITGLTGSIGAVRPSYSPDGSFLVYDTPEGVWRTPSSGGTPTHLVSGGFDATVSPDGERIAYLIRNGADMEIRTMPAAGGTSRTILTTSGKLENPQWRRDRVYFVEHTGDGYDGRSNVRLGSVLGSGGGFLTERWFGARAVGVDLGRGNDEMFFYREDGFFRYYRVRADASLPDPMLEGDGYTTGWSSMTSVDLEGDGQDEIFFYRDDGVFRYYQIKENASLPQPLLQGDGYTIGWDAITAVDLDGDGQDEFFFYRDDGVFRYYHIRSNGALPQPLLQGDGYTIGWDAITAVDLDGDGQDEMFFYRDDGVFRYYDIAPDGVLSSPINAGSDYPKDWTSISAIDLDGDGQDEMFFYRGNGEFGFYEVDASGTLGPAILEGDTYTTGWDVITSIDLHPG